jgi:beta-mannanase
MNKQAIYRIASLVMALVMILGNTAATQAATNPSIYWGAMVNGNVPSSTNLQGVFNTFETNSTKKMSIIHWGQPWKMKDGSWGEFQTTYFTNVRNHGSIPMINWASQRLGDGINQPDFQLRDIYNGNYDTYITRWATDAKNWGHPLFMRFNHEMNGWWFPWGEGKTSSGIVNGNSAGDFVKAWRHVHDIFEAVGATNVTWVWAPNHVGDTTDYAALSTVYPGDAYVDWTGFDVYNKYSTWSGLNPLLTGSEGMTWYKNSYDMVLSIAPNKPMMLAEFASIEAGDGGAKKAAWITDALTIQIPINFPQIKAVVWMNWDINSGKTYPIESSQAAKNAWAAGIGSSVYASNQYANLNTSPIPALSASVPTATVIPPSPTPTATTIKPSPTTATSTVLIAVADSYIDSGYPSSAFGTSTTLYVNAGTLNKTTFLKFDLSPLAGKTLSSVILKFKTTSAAAAGSVNTSNVKLVNDLLWKEPYLRYNNTVPITETILGTVPPNTIPGTWYTITLSASDIQNNVGGLLSMAIEATGSDNLVLFSREAANQPQLIITYQ